MPPGDTEQCAAVTASGQRCSRPAGEDGFCHQHGPGDETIEDGGSKPDGADEETANDDTETMSEDSQSEIEEVRDRVKGTAEGVVGRPLDGITSVNRDDGNWRVAVEVIERKGVPDTQDILGRYELRLDEDLTVNSYERTHRFRRDDMEHDV